METERIVPDPIFNDPVSLFFSIFEIKNGLLKIACFRLQPIEPTEAIAGPSRRLTSPVCSQLQLLLDQKSCGFCTGEILDNQGITLVSKQYL